MKFSIQDRSRALPGLLAAMAVIAGCQSAPPQRVQTGSELQLPASFTGTLPCQSCNGSRAQLDLWPDGVFHLSRT